MIIKKNLRIFFRNRSSSVIMVLGTFLVLFALVSFFSEDSQVVHVSYVVNQTSNVSDNILLLLSGSGFTLHNFSTSEECISSVTEGTSKICLSFPDNLTVSEDYNESLVFYIDSSRINVVYYILDQVMSEFSEYSTIQRHRLVSDMLTAIDDVYAMLEAAESQAEAIEENFAEVEKSLLLLKADIAKIDVSYPSLNTLNLSRSASVLITRFRQASLNSNRFRRLSESLIEEMDECGCLVNQSYLDTLNKTYVSHQETLNGTEAVIKTLSSNVNSFTKFYTDSTKSLDELKKLKKAIDSDIKDALELVNQSQHDLASLLNTIKNSKAEFDALEIRKAERILDPISAEIVPIADSSRLGIAIPSVFLILLVFSSLLFSSSLVIFNRDSRGGLRETISPKPRGLFYFSILASALVLVVSQALVFMVVVALLLGLSLVVFLQLALVSVCTALFFIFAGILIGNASDSKEMAFFISIVVTLILLLLSGEILPVEFISESLQSAIAHNPYEVFRSSFYRIIIHGEVGLAGLFSGYASIYIGAAVLALFSFYTFSTFRKLKTSRLYGKAKKPQPQKKEEKKKQNKQKTKPRRKK
jgi:hypothetical protein